jgi:hypothetical protein
LGTKVNANGNPIPAANGNQTNVSGFPSLPAPVPVGDIDGIIYAQNLPHENYLDRMLKTIGFNTIAQNGFEKFDYFKTLLHQTFFECCRCKNRKSINEEIAKKINEEIIHRFAFAITMEIPQLRSHVDWKIFIENCKSETTERVRIWVPLLQQLRIIYHQQGWGWCSRLYTTQESWIIEQNRPDPRPELFVVYHRNYQKVHAKLLSEKNTDNTTPKNTIADNDNKNNSLNRQHITAHYERLESERRKSIGGKPLSTMQAQEFSRQFQNTPTEQLRVICKRKRRAWVRFFLSF